jgi:uncharacterized protein YyaL (SSP411 family)
MDMASRENRNRLSGETSPYLLQHKDNPVHWWPWSEAAFEEARNLGKPVLLSVGYAACHWCHVMAHESFEDPEIARVMNDLFINIKVDREERPDVDALYMRALQHLGEQGGWPLTMFLTGDGEPFWGGTYFPNTAKFGRPAFTDVLMEVARIYREDRDKIAHNTRLLTDALKLRRATEPGNPLTHAILADMARGLLGLMDTKNGGIRGAPKFPNVSILSFLWRSGIQYDIEGARAAVHKTLIHIAQGGIYDHLGGGFARYAVDDRWLVPHFEKMLYDNALLISLMTECWKETGDAILAARIDETITWLKREMLVEDAAFASSLDADSEGKEGKFYVWSQREIVDVLGSDDGRFFCTHYDVDPEGNWEGKTVLNRLGSIALLDEQSELRLAEMRQRLHVSRETRMRPGWDDKVLADWNGLMIVALVRAAEAFDRDDWTEMARRAYRFIRERMSYASRLRHSYRAGKSNTPAVSSDYANMIAAALELHSTTGEPEFLDDAMGWADVMNAYYWSVNDGGYHLGASDTTDIILRTRSAADDATPNANGVMLGNLIALYLLTGDEAYQQRAHALEVAFRAEVLGNFVAHTSLLENVMSMLSPQHVIIMASAEKDAKDLLKGLRQVSLPGTVVQTVSKLSDLPPQSPARTRLAPEAHAVAFMCIGPQCSIPVHEPQALTDAIRVLRHIPC